MKKRTRLNLFCLAVVVSGAPIALTPSPALAGESEGGSGTCCEAETGSCWLNLGDGILVRESPAYAPKGGGACPASNA